MLLCNKQVYSECGRQISVFVGEGESQWPDWIFESPTSGEYSESTKWTSGEYSSGDEYPDGEYSSGDEYPSGQYSESTKLDAYFH